MVNKDALWKGIIKDLVEEFVHYFFSDFVEQIDFEQGFDFMDKELSQLSPQSESKLRHADQLFKAYLKNGAEQWFLVHVEVQGYSDPSFAKRMYHYAYRIQDRFNKPITALAIYTDTNPAYHFAQYHESFMGTEVIYRFQTYVLMKQKPQSLRKSNNLFGLIMEVAYQEMKYKKKDDEQRLNFATELVRYLFQQGVSKLKIRHLLDFIKCYIRFDQEDFFAKFEEEIQIITKSRQAMGIREAILHDVRKTGFEEGQAKGVEKGIEKGRAEKERIVVKRAWEKDLDVEVIAELADISKEKVETIIQDLIKEKENGANEEQIPLASKLNLAPILEENEKKRIAIVHAWQKYLPIEEIAELAGLSVKEVEAIIYGVAEEE